MTDPLDRFVRLFHRRWAVPVLGELGRDGGAKFITLANRLGAGRETLRETLDDLIDLRLVMRNPGHGHPMRPEYLLTAIGELLATPAGRLMGAIRRMDLQPIALRKWTMPLTYVLGPGERRFSKLREDLPAITPRALTLSLKDMQHERLVTRAVYDDYPPITCYRLRPRARPLLEALEPLALAV